MLSKCRPWQSILARATTTACRRTQTTRLLLRQQWIRATSSGGGLLPPIKNGGEEKEGVKDFSLLPQLSELETPPAAETPKSLNVSESVQVASKLNAEEEHRRRSKSPKFLLNAYYKADRKISEMAQYNDSVIEEGTGRDAKYLTSTVTCPITGVSMESGTLRDANDSSIKVIDGVVYYKKDPGVTVTRFRKHSQAAAARLLDSIRYTETGQVEPRLCEEEPILLPDTLLKEVQVPDSGTATQNPKNALSNEYDKLGMTGGIVVGKGMKTKKTEHGFTATYTCPVSSHSVTSGIAKGAASIHIVNGVPYYKTKLAAEKMAAARFLDDLAFSRTGVKEPRLCYEEPVGFSVELFDAPPIIVHSPLNVLDQKYKGIVRAAVGIDNWVRVGMKVEKLDEGWSATFKCPVTSHEVKSGQWKDGPSFNVTDGIVTYKSRRNAEHAAAARFLDDLHFSETGESEPRLCEEVPIRLPIENLTTENARIILRGALDILCEEFRRSWAQLKGQFSIKRVGRWYTATFTCPITGHEVGSGRMKKAKHHVVDGVVFYRDEKDAKKAAAARFLDQLQCTRGSTEPQMCEESPTAVKALGKIVKDSAVRKKSPRQLLRDIYGGSSFIKIFDTTSVADMKWTSVLTCPITGHVSPSGTLRNGSDTEKLDGRICYSHPVAAEMAAVARFLDDVRYTQTGESEPRLCDEFPVAVESGNLDRFSFDSGDAFEYFEDWARRLEQAPEAIDGENDSESEQQGRPAGSASPKRQEAETTVSELNLDLSKDESGDDEELVIQHVTPFASSGTSTLDRIMDVWVGAPKDIVGGGNDASLGIMSHFSPSQQKEKIIADTVTWHDRLARQSGQSSNRGFQVFQTGTSTMSMKSATAALRALAKAHWNDPSPDPDTNKKVEAAAQQMIDLMWTIDSPTIDGYNSFLRCLARPNATETAQAAEDTLRAMISRKKKNGVLILPEPNIETFNTVIQLWALVGGDAGFSKCEEIFDLIHDSQSQGVEVQPNRDTFLSVLSSLARPLSAQEASCFSLEAAQRWIDRLQQMGDEINDTTLTTDTQVFNAPLRWSGGVDASATRPFAQRVSWDCYEDLLENGFRQSNEADPLWREAQEIEDWLLAMETNGPDPDVETYEAAIQAWSRTGMAKGLERAEQVAFRALASDNILPRLQTFHPIFAAWAYSGDDRSLEKIHEWAARLSPEISLDQRLDMAIMISRRISQKRLLSNDVSNESIEKALQLANSCTNDLGKLVESNKDDDALLDPALFSHAQSAWGDTAIASASSDIDATNKAVVSMVETVKQFDDAVRLARVEASKDSTDEQDGRLDIQLKLLLRHSQTLYLNAVSTLNKLDEQRSQDDSGHAIAFDKYIFAVEAMLRRSQEHQQLLYTMLGNDASPDDIQIRYKDLFSYSTKLSDAGFDLSFLEKQVALYLQVVNGCRRLTNTKSLSEAVRLVMLILDFCNQSRSNTFCRHQKKAVDCTELYLGILDVVSAVPTERDRHALFRRIFHSVNALADKKGDNVPFVIDRKSILSTIKKLGADSSLASSLETTKHGGGKQVRPRRARTKRQKWRSASAKR